METLIDSAIKNEKHSKIEFLLFYSELSNQIEGEEIIIKGNVCIYEICIKFTNKKVAKTMTSTALDCT